MNQKIETETKDIELIIGKILRIGVIVAATVIVIGLAMFLIEGTGVGRPQFCKASWR